MRESIVGYLSRHWRGELSLPVAFWVNNFLLLFPLGVALGLLMAWAAAWGQSLQTLSLAALGGLVLLALVSVWAPIGAWRSATCYLDEGGSAGWGLAAQFVLGLGMLGNAITFAFDVVPGLPGQLRLAAGRDPIGSLNIALAEDRRSVTLSGPFGMGAAARFEQVVKKAPQLRYVVLDSPGGRLYEAHEIATVVRQRGLRTRASGDCASACTLVFVAGTQRSLAGPARLGFHRASVPSLNPLHDELANRKLAQLYAEAGMPEDFVAGVLRTPARHMWFPAADVLAAAGILPRPTLQPELDPALPADAPLERYREALTDNALWIELDRRHPGLLDAAADRMLQARRRGLALEAVAQDARAVAMTAVPDVLRSAGPRSQEAYLQVLAAGLRKRRAGGEAACQAVLALADDAMSVRLGSWMQAALAESAERQPARALSPLELEVLRRELGVGASERIAALVAAPGVRNKGHACAKTIELLDAMARLRAPQRRLAVRLMLQTPG
jgi:hypothetical protein